MRAEKHRVGTVTQVLVHAGATQVSATVTDDPNWWEITSDLSGDSPSSGVKAIDPAADTAPKKRTQKSTAKKSPNG